MSSVSPADSISLAPGSVLGEASQAEPKNHNFCAADHLPNWAEGDISKLKNYCWAHRETWLDRLLTWIACRLGVIVHGDITHERLEKKLKAFDICRLLEEGPYESQALSKEAQELIRKSLNSVSKVMDVHLHNLGYDEGNYVNPKLSMLSKFTFLVLRHASGMTSVNGSTNEARKRIHLYAQHFPKLHGWILPIHPAAALNKTVDWKNTGNFLSNRSAWKTAQLFESKSSKIFAAVSIHPADPQWESKLNKAHAQGIRLVKWMPPQSISPDSLEYFDFYRKMAHLKMTLIAHSGPEHALQSLPEWEDAGNPLRFRNALRLGVNVILAHCGHKDKIPDLDDREHKKIPGCELFIRLAREAYRMQYPGKLYGDLAGVSTHYGADFVKELLKVSQEPGIRFVFGSDYPYTNLIQIGKDPYTLFAHAGLLDSSLIYPLREIRAWNPLLANFVCTAQLSLKTDHGNLSFPQETFSGNFHDAPLHIEGIQLCLQSLNQT